MDDVKLDFRSRKFNKRIAEGFDGTVHITFDNNIQLLEITDCNPSTDLIESDMLLRAQSLFALKLSSLIGNLLSLLVAFHDVELVTCLRGSVQTQYESRSGRADLVYFSSPFIIHCLNMSEASACEHNIADP